jgi:hypothetical protein
MKVTGPFSFYLLLGLILTCFLCCNLLDLSLSFPSPAADPNLIFQTGFAGSSKVVATNDKQIDDLIGMDSTLAKPNDWVADLDDHPNIGTFRIYYEGGQPTQRAAEITEDPTDPENRVLRFRLSEPNAGQGASLKGRIQADIYDNKGLKEIYQSVRVYFPPAFNRLKSYTPRIYWLTLFELWNNPSWEDPEFPFRVSINLEKPASERETDLYFRVYGQDKSVNDSWTSVWEQTNSHIPVPLGEWITLDIYVREGGSTDGRFYMTMTPENSRTEVLFDITNYTHHPADPDPDGLSHFNPMKLYTFKELIYYMQDNGQVLEVFWDDYILWKDRRPELDDAE